MHAVYVSVLTFLESKTIYSSHIHVHIHVHVHVCIIIMLCKCLTPHAGFGWLYTPSPCCSEVRVHGYHWWLIYLVFQAEILRESAGLLQGSRSSVVRASTAKVGGLEFDSQFPSVCFYPDLPPPYHQLLLIRTIIMYVHSYISMYMYRQGRGLRNKTYACM